MNTKMSPKFERLTKMIGEESLTTLSSKTVLVIGIGGVGGYVCEVLVRSGIKNIIIVDGDVVENTNLNRQIIALNSTIGKAKVDVMKERIQDINSECQVQTINEFITNDNIELLFETKIDYLVDACDTVSTKKRIILECLKRKIPFISCMGTGNKLDPSKLEIIDIRNTKNDPLARIIRKFVKDERITKKVLVLSSTEVPIKTGDSTPGSTAFVPASAGLLIASYIIRNFINKK